MRRRTRNLILALVVGLIATAVPANLQHRFKAGSVPDLLCELVLLPGMLAAIPFGNRGTASPEFLRAEYLATFLLFGGLTYLVLWRKQH